MAPSDVKTKLIIKYEQKTKTNPIIAAQKIFLPLPINSGLPAEIIIRIAPIEIAITAKGVAICKTIKDQILLSIVKKSVIVQLPLSPVHCGTNGCPILHAANVKLGVKTNKNNKNNVKNKIIFCIYLKFLCAPAATRTRNFWFEAKYDIQFRHRGSTNI